MATSKSTSATGTGFKLSVMTLAIMNVTAVVSLRGLPSEAVYGPSSAFYYLFAAIVFLIPTALVAAELAAMFSDKQGGVFRWVGEAMGARTGFLAIWLQWIESTIWYPTVLTFGAVAIAFIGIHPQHDMMLASNKIFTLIVVLVIYWLATFIALKGLTWVGKISKIGGMIGTIIPAGLLIVLGIIYLSTGGHNNMDMSQGFFPDLTKFDNLVLASGIFLFYAGMEMMGIHVMDVKNPSKNYPKAIFIGSLITVCIFVLGTFSLGFIIPAKDINLTQSLLIGFDNYFQYLHMSWASPIIAVALMFGVLAGVLTWVTGPSKGIFTVGKAGYLPPFFQKANKAGVQRNILIIQGCVVTVLSLLFVVMPSVQSFYQILSQLTVLLYVSADVHGGDHAPLQDAQSRAPVPCRQGQRTDLVYRRTGLLRRFAGIHSELYSAQPDFDRQQCRMVLGADHRVRRSRRGTFHHLRFAQALVAGPRSRQGVSALPLGKRRSGRTAGCGSGRHEFRRRARDSDGYRNGSVRCSLCRQAGIAHGNRFDGDQPERKR